MNIVDGEGEVYGMRIGTEGREMAVSVTGHMFSNKHCSILMFLVLHHEVHSGHYGNYSKYQDSEVSGFFNDPVTIYHDMAEYLSREVCF